MTDAMNGLVSEAKRNRFATIGSVLSDEDVISVWENVSGFIEKQMAQHKGVNISGLGIFTFSQKKLDVGNNKFILIQRPVFLLSEKFAQIHQLQHRKHHVTGKIPVVQLNFTSLSFESPFDRDTVEACVKEVLQALSRSIGSMKSVEFTFQGIGKLHIREGKVKMKFYKEFLTSMDGTGQLIKAVKDRKSMQDSVLSECSGRTSSWAILNVDQTPTKICALVLPKICPSPTANVPDISHLLVQRDTEGDEKSENVKEECGYVKDELNPCVDTEADEVLKNLNDQKKFVLPVPPSSSCRMLSQLETPRGMNTSDDILTQNVKNVRSNVTPPGCKSPFCVKRSLTPIKIQSGTAVKTPPCTPPEKKLTKRTSSLDEVFLKKPSPLQKIITPPIEKKVIVCGHSDAGQELCYLCHQRDHKNVPISFTAERKKLENEEDRLLQQYQHVKDTEAILQEHETMLAKRHENQKMAAFNLGVSEALKTRKQAREIDFHSSYVFQKRPVTPPRFFKQTKYFNELKDQVSMKDERYTTCKAKEDLMERLEQVQLAEDLALQREEYLKEKAEQTDQYKRALSAQIIIRDSLQTPNSKLKIRKNKQMIPPTLPSPQIILPFSETVALKILDGSKVVKYKPLASVTLPDSVQPVFGKNDMNSEKLLEKRRLAHDVYQEQLSTVEQRKREAILGRVKDQKEEADMLERCKEELRSDRAEKYQRMYMTRKHLEDDWTKAMENKYFIEREEKLRFQSPALLVHEQCDRYKRCGQCKRRVSNCGESNIWRDSRYIPGSRLMV